jgi:membrane protein YqaA with SNARE-associated domain
MSFLTRLSQWLLATLEPYGAPGLLVLAICDSSFLSLPEVNDAALMALSIANPSRMWLLASATVLGSIIGCTLLYSVGRKGGEALLTRRFASDKVVRIRAWYEKYGMLAIIVPSLLPPPLPFKIFVLCAGAFRISWLKFMIAVGIGRSIRYFTEGVVAVRYGSQAMEMVKQNSGPIGLLLATLIVVGTLVYVYTRRRRGGTTALVFLLMLPFSGCIVRTRNIADALRMKDSHPFTREQALDRLRRLSAAVETMQTSISLSGTLPEAKDKAVVTDFGPISGALAVQRPGNIALEASFIGYGFEMRSDGDRYEVYISSPKQVHVGSEADIAARSSCKLSDRARQFINIRPRQIMEAVLPDFRPMLDSPSNFGVSSYMNPVVKDQRTYYVVDFHDMTSRSEPRLLQRVWFDLSEQNVDIVRRQTWDKNGALTLDTEYKNHTSIGDEKVRYPMRFDVQFVPLNTLLKITIVDPQKIDLNEKVDPENFAMGTRRNTEVCNMEPISVAQQ